MKKLIFSIALLTTMTTYGQGSYSLQQAKDYAIQHNLNVKNALLDVETASQKVKETTAIGLPQISGSVAFQNFLDIPTTLIPANAFDPNAPADLMAPVKFGTDFNMNGTLQVSQLIFSGNYLVGLQAAKTYKNVSLQMVAKSEQQIKIGVTEAYYTVVTLQDNLTALDSTLINIQKLLSDTKILIGEKVLENSNALQLELSVLELETGKKQIEEQVIVASKLLKLQMGMDLKTEITLSDNLDSFVSDLNGEISSSINVAENIDYQLMQTNLALNELSVKNAKAFYLPTLSGFFTHQQVAMGNQFNFFGSDGNWYPTTIWGLNLSIPIFSSGQGASVVNQAKITLEKTQNSIELMDQGLQLQMSQSVSSFNSAIETKKTRLKAIEIAQEVLRTSEIKYKEKVISSMELTQAQSQVIQAKTNLITAKFEVLKAKLAMDKLTNKL